MNFLKKILNKLNGLYYPNEYLCFSNEFFEQPLNVYLLNNKQVVKDITTLHSFVGYCPVVFVIPLTAIPDAVPQTTTIVFSQKTFSPNEYFTIKDAIARLSLKKINEQPIANDTIIYYKAIKGQHRFLSLFHQFIIQLNNGLYHKKQGNVFLEGNLYKQVQIAYSIPRNISLISIGEKNKFNLFPTDLHGPVGNEHYIISLRHQGKACQQVCDSKKILLTQVESSFYKTVYDLGKNHMQPLKPSDNFPFSGQLSGHLKLPLPESAIFYRELELEDSFICGIHRIMLFKTLYQQGLEQNISTLAHIHNTYATWRHNKGLAGNYLLR